MIILPGLYQIYRSTGVKPVIMICEEFAPMLKRVSYVDAFPVSGVAWNTGARAAAKLARNLYDEVFVPKWWDAHLDPPAPKNNEPFIEVDWRGRRIILAQDEWNSYQYSQWKSCGWSRQQLLDWPLVFDRRDSRDEAFQAGHYLHPKKPNVLYNFSGVSNPLGFEPEVVRELHGLVVSGKINLVDLGRVRLTYLPDLLGLYDRSLCLITGDTSTLHLAAASEIPVIALLADGWAGSIVKGNEKLRLRYSEVRNNVHRIRETVEKLL
jgi:hypothetical protein